MLSKLIIQASGNCSVCVGWSGRVSTL